MQKSAWFTAQFNPYGSFCRKKYEIQEQQPESPHGKLATKCYFVENVLRIEVLNARGIKPTDLGSKLAIVIALSLISIN